MWSFLKGLINDFWLIKLSFNMKVPPDNRQEKIELIQQLSKKFTYDQSIKIYGRNWSFPRFREPILLIT